MSQYPDWVLTLSDSDLVRHFGAETVRRGHDYAREARVSHIKVAGSMVTGTVRGQRYHSYFSSVVSQGTIDSLVATCVCPVRFNCKHCVALIVHMRTVQQRRSAPSWQRALDPLVSRRSAVIDGEPLALAIGQSSHGITLRPLRQGARGGWVKTGVTWDSMSYAPAYNSLQRLALLALYRSQNLDPYIYGTTSALLHANETAPGFWRLLRKVLDVGVVLVGDTDPYRRTTPTPRLLAEPLTPEVCIGRVAGGLLLRPALVMRDELIELTPTALVGRPAHGVAFTHGEELLLGELTRPLDDAEHELFTRTGQVRVPDDDVELFASGFLPQLRARMPVRLADDVVLPELSPPVLICRVFFGPRAAQVEWGFRYRLGTREFEVGLEPSASDPPLRQPDAEAALTASVPDGPWRWYTVAGQAMLDPVQVAGRELIRLVSQVLPELSARDDVEVITNERPPVFTEVPEAPRINLRISDGAADDWFNLNVEVTIAGEQVPFAPLFAALSRREEYLLLDSGTWFSLDHRELDRLRAVIEEASAIVETDAEGTYRLRPEHAGLWEELVSLGVVAEQSAAWQSAAGALLNLEELPELPPPAGLRAELRPYQLLGFRWLSFLWRSRLGGILADEMGLGKTLQALALVQAAHESDELDAPVLVVAPTSVVGTWAAEAARFAPELAVTTITKTGKKRRVPLDEAVAEAQLVVTSYTLLRLEAADYAALRWSAVLLDEAQFVKNHRSQAYQAVRKLPARMKVALTGTPLENNLGDLWSLLSISAPGLFTDPKVFTELYRKPIEQGDAEVLARLQRRIRPLILRRTKAAVATELPDKQEQVIPVELAPGHRRIYDKRLARERQKVLGLVDDLTRNRITILRSLTVLRQLSLSPVLVDPGLPEVSAKIDTLVELLGELIAGGHRALVFSQFTGFLRLIRERLDAEQIGYEYLDGRTRDRPARIESFRSGDAPVFLISLKAGGFGLTLTEADYVFICDPWWNPAAETQAIDRTHRIGQDKPVNVYRLVASDTIEEKVVALQERKRLLFDQVVGQASDIAAPLSADDIRGLLDLS